MEIILKPKPSKWLMLIVWMMISACIALCLSLGLYWGVKLVVSAILLGVAVRWQHGYVRRIVYYRYLGDKHQMLDAQGRVLKITSVRLGRTWVSVCFASGGCEFFLRDQFTPEVFSHLKRSLLLYRKVD